ncbi:MAG: AraC family transcriptional regulator [Spirochaetia bacterium]|nr:AraC family transcriptional regulator [Spirochaetia bacterium]
MKSGVEYFNTIAPSADLNLLYTGRELCPPGKHCSGIRSHFLLHYVLEGSGWIGSSEGPLRLTAGDIFCYFPEQSMDYTSDGQEPWQFAWIGFQGKRSDKILRQCGFSENRIVCRLPFSAHIARRFSTLIRNQSQRKRGYQLVADGQLLQLLGELSAEIPRTTELKAVAGNEAKSYNHFTPQHRRPQFYVEAMKQFIHSNYQKPISIQQVIEYIGVDRSYASRIFHQLENRTLQRYLIELRMSKARQLLVQRYLSIQAVAHSVGYSDYASFERRFRAEFGYPPSEC